MLRDREWFFGAKKQIEDIAFSFAPQFTAGKQNADDGKNDCPWRESDWAGMCHGEGWIELLILPKTMPRCPLQLNPFVEGRGNGVAIAEVERFDFLL
jgi:hypothetical protein